MACLPLRSVWTGCGWEELAGLLHENLDLDDGWLHVSTAAAETASGGYDLKPYLKNDYRRRSVELPQNLIEALRFHVAGSSDSRLVFPDTEGGVLHYSNFYNRVVVPAVARSGLERFTFHDLRHTHCGWLIDQGWADYKIVRRMGWRDSRMLYTTYGPLMRRRDREGMHGLDQAWADGRAGSGVT